MENIKKSKLFEEQLREFKHRVDYKINETPKYRSLVNTGEQFDEIPKLTNEAGDQEDAPLAQQKEPVAPSNDLPIEAGQPPVPEFDAAGGGEEQPPAEPMGVNPMGDDMNQPAAPEQQVNDIQNDIIKHNLEAMKSIHDKLESLETTVSGLNSKLATLNADVEEVREPTNSEKLMNKVNVSYPYYYNLNDLWSGNWFNEKREQENEKGIKELPDGTFVADFDDLPQKSKTDIQNSFNDI